MTFRHPPRGGVFYTVPIRMRAKHHEIFDVHVDTGSGKLWLYSSHCASPPCKGIKGYPPGGPAFSTGEKKTTHFADGTRIAGTWSTDYVDAAGRRMEFCEYA